MTATVYRAPDITTLDLVSELRVLLNQPAPAGGVEAAVRIENHINEVLHSWAEGPNPTILIISNDHYNPTDYEI